jgi:hypothetical protein
MIQSPFNNAETAETYDEMQTADARATFAAHMAQAALGAPLEVGSIKLVCVEHLGNIDQQYKNELELTCPNFLKKSDSADNWGKALTQAIDKLPEEKAKKTFLSNQIPDMDFICPNFSKFDDDLKKQFWIWTFASIAYNESSCKSIPDPKGRGVNTVPVGLLQLEDSVEMRKSRGPNCKVSDMIKPANNLACGVDILMEQLLGPDSTYFDPFHQPGFLFRKNSYWENLRYKKRTDKTDQQLLLHSLSPSSREQNSKTGVKELVMRFKHCRS